MRSTRLVLLAVLVVVGAPVGAARADLAQLVEARHNMVFLDLGNVTRIDSAALSVLLAWVQALHGQGWLGVVGPSAGIRRLLLDAGLIGHPNVRVFGTRQEARIATGERQST